MTLPLPGAEPAEVMATYTASHMVATSIFLNDTAALGTDLGVGLQLFLNLRVEEGNISMRVICDASDIMKYD